MAHAEYELTGDLDALVEHLCRHVTASSATARLEHRSERQLGPARMATLVFERYSATGSNRLGLTFSILAVGNELAVTATTAGGSTGLLFKINTFGEAAFLDKADEAIRAFFPTRPGPGSALGWS